MCDETKLVGEDKHSADNGAPQLSSDCTSVKEHVNKCGANIIKQAGRNVLLGAKTETPFHNKWSKWSKTSAQI